MQPQPFTFHALDGLLRIADENVLVIDMVAGQELSQRGGKAYRKLGLVRGVPFVIDSAAAERGQVFRITERIKLYLFVAYLYTLLKADVAYQFIIISFCQRTVPLHDAQRFFVAE